MLYDYKFSLAQMGQLKNYKRDKKFEHTLLNIEDVELSTYEINCTVSYKKTVPLNMFEKYAIRLIEKADEIYSDMDIEKIANLLHLDESLVRENLENLEAIDMLNGINSDIITINRDENSTYLQYENKFKVESLEKTHHLTKLEYESIDSYVQKEFEKESDNKDKKFKSLKILNERESSKSASIFHYSDSNFLLYSKDGINQHNDLKFIDDTSLSTQSKNQNIADNILCHYDEFLPLLRDKLSVNKDNLALIGTKKIDKNSLDVLKANKNMDKTFILSTTNREHKRVFNIEVDDFVWIGEEFYLKEGNFIVKNSDSKIKERIKQKLTNYFRDKILEIEPDYDSKKVEYLEKKVFTIEDELNKCEFQTLKEVDSEIERFSENKNKLYGTKSKKSKVRADVRKKIDKFESSKNLEELKKYPVYIENRDKIFGFKKSISLLENLKTKIKNLNQDIIEINTEKSKLISKSSKEKIEPFLKELKIIKGLKI